ncbi:membrane-bound lytic murein transglycosylase MltD-like protein [Psychroflexus torquis ATCC 700755]|uniref:Membrane-bound lytic murein transglycosylase MltD-like protein n=1 Tax=Psychroflexus torquis (strain ATCC 700755 / CIP 106069 / ACAM 623) TaxID=313595 RepID=K4IJ43_PSYTT|nr:lytic transglycosylase domain-containing protein [Psychroflexus torquis]AFU69116.1 membrane-bound lytic murein transglycosylase MltD-like protein [Psychroflexus torquis ATCC 700755]
MTYKSLISLFAIFLSCLLSSAQDTKEKVTQKWATEKVEFHKITGDSLELILEDYQRNMELDSVWRSQLINQSYSKRMEIIIKDSLESSEVIKEIPTELLKERLAALNAKTPFNIEYNESLESVISYFLKREKEGTERLMGLSKFYFPMFEATLDKYDVPLEMKYLALVESALNPKAKSRVGATGLWQFMYSTGKMYDLDVSSYVDERMDPVASTEAAAQYLKRLYLMFNDWDLALAAYNSGPGNVSKAIRRSGGETNYWKLRSYLPRETAGYVPSFQAMLYMYEYAEEHGFKPQRPKTIYYGTDTIRVKKMITLDQIAEVTQTEKEFIEFLNPSYKLGIIPFEDDKSYYIRLPYAKSGLFVANEDKIYGYAEEQLAKTEDSKAEDKINYYVKSGDFLGRIASKFRVRISEIRTWNNLRSNSLNIGQRLVIYPRNTSAIGETKPSSEESNTETSSLTDSKIYKVKSGDSLWIISRKYSNLSVEDLKSLNQLKSNTLKPGMTLKVSKG